MDGILLEIFEILLQKNADGTTEVRNFSPVRAGRMNAYKFRKISDPRGKSRKWGEKMKPGFPGDLGRLSACKSNRKIFCVGFLQHESGMFDQEFIIQTGRPKGYVVTYCVKVPATLTASSSVGSKKASYLCLRLIVK